MNKKILIPIIVIVIIIVGIGALFILQKPAFPQSKIRNSFFEVHMEPSNVNNEMFNGLTEFVDLADEYKVKLTLLFTPQWAEMILVDEAKLNLLNQWKQKGHEIGGHHHGPSVCPWDGYTNLDINSREFKSRQNRVPCPPFVRAKERYLGNVDDYMGLLNKLGPIKTITMSDEDVDWPKGALYAAGGIRLERAISQPKMVIFNGHKVYKLTSAPLEPKRLVTGMLITIDELKNKYLSGEEGIFGVVNHPQGFRDNPNLYKQWFEFLKEQNSKSKTVSETMEEYLKSTQKFQEKNFSYPTTTPTLTQEPKKDVSKIYPFGIMAAFDPATLTTISAADKVAWAGEKFRDLGAKWSRNGGDTIIWGILEPKFGQGYDWSNPDGALKKAYENGGVNFNTVGVINPQRGKGGNPDVPLDKEDYYSKFVEALVERYDGDGINDYSPIIKVKYWQMANEPFPRQWEQAGGTIDGYVRFAGLTYNAIKKSDPTAKIILGTFQLEKTEEIDKFKEVIPKMKNKNLFDYVDTHYWNSGNNYKIPVGEARSVLDSNGYSNAKMVVLEFGTWMARSSRESTTEKDQANYLIKGYAYNIAHGFLLINWNNLVEWANFGGSSNSIYNFMGLIADGANNDQIPAGTPRLSYYTYKKMTEILEGSDWNNIQTIKEEQNDAYGIFLYKFTKNGKPIYVGWYDCFDEQKCSRIKIDTRVEITLDSDVKSIKITEAIPKYNSGKDITDYSTAFNTETKSVSDWKVMIALKDTPVFVEEK